MSEEELRALAVGTVLSFDLGRLRVSAVKHHGERFTLHSRTVPIGVLAGVPALRRVLRDRATREEPQ